MRVSDLLKARKDLEMVTPIIINSLEKINTYQREY